MKKMARKLSILLAAAMAAGSLTACSGISGDVAATYGSESISMDEASFWLRYEQWMNEAYYWDMYTYFGYENMWEAPSGDGEKTMADSLTESVMTQLLQSRVLIDHAEEYNVALTEAQKEKITETVTSFLEEYPDFKNYCDASQEEIEGWMQTNSLAVLVADAVKKAANVTVSDEECQQYSIEYILVSEEDEDTAEESAEEDSTEEETTATGEELANQVLAQAKEGKEFSDIASELSLTASNASYLVTGETSTDIRYTTSAAMAVGDVEMVQEEGTGWYIIKKSNDLDEDATESKREEVQTTKETEAFNEVYAEWAKSAAKFDVKKAWTKVEISDKIYVAPETEEAAEDESADAEDETVESETEETAATEAE
ncbi:MAG: peptidylprolyl isomerase [Clostridiales bacterium]|nr:peptidylprolyl isomerase [Clostridiales bacterium]